MSLRAFTPESGRQSPFKRQNSTASASSVRTTTPTPTPTSPSKPSPLSPHKTTSASLSPEKASPFVRRPSQISHASDRPTSPFGRPSSALSIPSSPSRQPSIATRQDETPPASPKASSVMPVSLVERSASATSSPSPFDGPAPESPSFRLAAELAPRSTPQRSERALSTASTIKAPKFTMSNTSLAPKLGAPAGGYNHVPQPLLRSMRESFEVLDSSNSGSIDSASVASMLEQMGLPHSPADVRDFFQPNAPIQLNLARYLDTLSGPMADLSQADELAAAFEAFDVDDSGQIDVKELKNALFNTAPEPGEQMVRLSESEVDSILSGFSARRAFGAKGVSVAKGKGEVFRWRDFVGSINGGIGNAGQEGVAAA